jgi:NLI interacting factor-like phosphatase
MKHSPLTNVKPSGRNRCNFFRTKRTSSEDAASATAAPPAASDLIVFLDLDLCLVRTKKCDSWAPMKALGTSRTLTIEAPWSRKGGYLVIEERRGLQEFLETVCARYQVHLFTGATENYATAIMEAVLHPLLACSPHYFVDSCSSCSEVIDGKVKDLTPILESMQQSSGKTMEELWARTVLVDDRDVNFIPQPSNGILIPKFVGYKRSRQERKDTSLQAVVALLQELEPNHVDVRQVLAKRHRISKTMKANHEQYSKLKQAAASEPVAVLDSPKSP